MVQHIHIVCMNITVSSDHDIGFVAVLQNFVEITNLPDFLKENSLSSCLQLCGGPGYLVKLKRNAPLSYG